MTKQQMPLPHGVYAIENSRGVMIFVKAQSHLEAVEKAKKLGHQGASYQNIEVIID